MTDAPQKTVLPQSVLSGTILVPSDKSITHRAILFSALAKGKSVIKNPLEGEDCLSSLSCVESLGLAVERGRGEWTVEGKGLGGMTRPDHPLDCGNSGTTMRLISGILSALPFSVTLDGDESLRARPMKRIAEPLTAMGAQFHLREDKLPPIEIHGAKNLKGIEWKNPVASAQVKSAVLLAALNAEGKTIYEEPGASRDHSERMLSAAGAHIQKKGNRIEVEASGPLKTMEWLAPRDFSSAAFFIVAALLAKKGETLLPEVNVNQTRTGLLTVLKRAGAQINIENEKEVGGEPSADIIVQGGQTLKGFEINAEDAPSLIDEIPILAVAAALAEGTSTFSGLKELRVKETDRLKALATNLQQMGVTVHEKEDGLIIEGREKLNSASLQSFGDHRIAMAFAIAGLNASGETHILNPDCVDVSFPGFWVALQNLC